MEIARAFLLVLAVSAVVCGLVVLATACTHAEPPAGPEDLGPEVAELIEWIAAHSDDVSLLAYTATDGDPRSVIALNEDAPRFLASTAKLVVLGAYAREAEAGRLDPDERVPLQDVDAWYLPGSDLGAHEAAIGATGVSAGATVRLDDVARAMIVFSDNAATDYLLHRLGANAIAEAVRAMGLRGQALPLRPSLGATLALGDPSLGVGPLERARRLAELSAPERSDLEAQLVRAYRQDRMAFQAAYQDVVTELGSTPSGLDAQLTIAPLLIDWKGTAVDFARILELAPTGRLINPGADEIIRRHIAAWAAQGDLTSIFREAGGKDGLMPGIRTIAASGIPFEGDYAGERRVVVLLLNGLDGNAFLSLLESEAFEKLASLLALDREVVEYLDQRVTSNRR